MENRELLLKPIQFILSIFLLFGCITSSMANYINVFQIHDVVFTDGTYVTGTVAYDTKYHYYDYDNTILKVFNKAGILLFTATEETNDIRSFGPQDSSFYHYVHDLPSPPQTTILNTLYLTFLPSLNDTSLGINDSVSIDPYPFNTLYGYNFKISSGNFLTGISQQANPSAKLIDTIPEPSSLFLIFAGLLGLSAIKLNRPGSVAHTYAPKLE